MSLSTENCSNQYHREVVPLEQNWIIRKATEQDLPEITEIYNQGIVDRIATLEDQPKTDEEVKNWLFNRAPRYTVLVIETEAKIVGWASLNPYSYRCAYKGVAELSIYIHRDWRGKGLGKQLLQKIEEHAKQNAFYKIVLFTFPFNVLGQSLYKRLGYREVGTFYNQGILDGKFVDVMAMEKMIV